MGVSLVDLMHGPDRILLQQIASRWEDLRSEFGDMLLPRLSGTREQQPRRDVWGALAWRVRELENPEVRASRR